MCIHARHSVCHYLMCKSYIFRIVYYTSRSILSIIYIVYVYIYTGYTSLYPYHVFPSSSSSNPDPTAEPHFTLLSQASQSTTYSLTSTASTTRPSPLPLFAGLSVLNLIGAEFDDILRLTGFDNLLQKKSTMSEMMRYITEQHDNKYSTSNRKGGSGKEEKEMVYIVVDTFRYMEVKAELSKRGASTTAASTSLIKQTSSSTSTSSYLNPSDVIVLDRYLQLPVPTSVGDTPARDNRPYRIVTLDWLVNCLELNEFLDPSLSPLYSLPSDVTLRPTVFKHTADKGGARYSINDVVVYSVSSPGKDKPVRHVGKIRSFTRRSETHPLSAHIQPFTVLPGREVEPTHTGATAVGDRVIPASDLGQKISVFTQESYKALGYTRHEDAVYKMSVAWQEAYQVSVIYIVYTLV